MSAHDNEIALLAERGMLDASKKLDMRDVLE